VLGAVELLLTTAAMIAFAANSLLCRAALAHGAIDALSFTAIRLASGAVVLLAITGGGGGDHEAGGRGSWRSALALALYAVAFSAAYVRIGAAAGALLLFGAVQLTMLAGALLRGERPPARQWAGLIVAAIGMVVINLPGLGATSPLGAALMIVAGVAWGVYSLRGRGARNPVLTTAGNFVRSLPFAAVLGAIAAAATPRITLRGVLLAGASGGVTSAVGYCLWYAALPALGAARAAIVQLSVPVIAAAGAIVLLHEPLRRHIAIGGAVILGGLVLALWQRSPASRLRR
jgi:drug/metabolite transporter (DMT)-like permease